MTPAGLALLVVLMGGGYLWARRVCPDLPLLPCLALGHLSGAAALGAGMTLGIVFQNEPSLLKAGGGLLVLIGGAILVRRPPPAPGARLAIRKLPLFLESRTAGIILTALVLLGLVTMVARVALLPLDWDGWAIWQFKAKALALGTLREQLTDSAYLYSHPDYPLLLPTHTWWLSAGGFSEKAAQIGGLLFGIDLLILVYYALRQHLTLNGGLAGLLVLLSWPLFQKHVSSGFADVPLAAYNLALVLLVWRGRWLAAAPVLIGALLTKNEGLFSLAAAAVISVTAFWSPAGAARPRFLRAAGPLVAGVVTVVAWAVVKQRWHLRGDLLDPTRWPTDPLEVARRAPVIAAGALREWIRIGPAYPGWGLFWPFAAVGLGLSIRRRPGETLPFWVLVGVQMAAIAAAYLLSPIPPEAHMHSSLDRLLLQVAPAALVGGMIAVCSGPGSSGAVNVEPALSPAEMSGDRPDRPAS